MLLHCPYVRETIEFPFFFGSHWAWNALALHAHTIPTDTRVTFDAVPDSVFGASHDLVSPRSFWGCDLLTGHSLQPPFFSFFCLHRKESGCCGCCCCCCCYRRSQRSANGRAKGRWRHRRCWRRRRSSGRSRQNWECQCICHHWKLSSLFCPRMPESSTTTHILDSKEWLWKRCRKDFQQQERPRLRGLQQQLLQQGQQRHQWLGRYFGKYCDVHKKLTCSSYVWWYDDQDLQQLSRYDDQDLQHWLQRGLEAAIMTTTRNWSREMTTRTWGNKNDDKKDLQKQRQWRREPAATTTTTTTATATARMTRSLAPMVNDGSVERKCAALLSVGRISRDQYRVSKGERSLFHCLWRLWPVYFGTRKIYGPGNIIVRSQPWLAFFAHTLLILLLKERKKVLIRESAQFAVGFLGDFCTSLTVRLPFSRDLGEERPTWINALARVVLDHVGHVLSPLTKRRLARWSWPRGSFSASLSAMTVANKNSTLG